MRQDEKCGNEEKHERSAVTGVLLVFQDGRYWDRTSDLFGVNEALYH